jgi:hypothetical protein
MGVNASRVKYLMDTDSAVVLRNASDGAETATATETAVSLNELDTAEWDDGKVIPHGIIAVQIYVTANDSTTGDETVTLSLLVDDTSDLSNTPVTVWSQALPVGFTGAITAHVDAKNIPLVDTDSSGTDKWIAIKATLAGTTPSVTYGAWIAKSIKG